MGISDGPFRVGVIGSALALAVVITVLRFCGDVTMPAKPPAPVESAGTAPSRASSTVYLERATRDATELGLRTPSLEDLGRAFVYREDRERHVLEVGDPALEAAGLAIAVVPRGDVIALDITNTTDADLAYRIVTRPTPNMAGCNAARPLPFNALVIERGARVTRVECVARAGIAIAVTRVETMELPPLCRWYIQQLPPGALGIEPRIARGHRGLDAKERCNPVVSQALRRAIEEDSEDPEKSGGIGWRDLVDFYARHRCHTYQFPLEYRAFDRDGAVDLPATAANR